MIKCSWNFVTIYPSFRYKSSYYSAHFFEFDPLLLKQVLMLFHNFPLCDEFFSLRLQKIASSTILKKVNLKVAFLWFFVICRLLSDLRIILLGTCLWGRLQLQKLQLLCTSFCQYLNTTQFWIFQYQNFCNPIKGFLDIL